MYIGFPIYPYTEKIPRSIIKPPKVYFYDNADTLSDDDARLENLVATSLLKQLHLVEDYEGYATRLHYIRDKEGREVDFAVVIDGELVALIEVKLTNTQLSSSLRYYTEKLRPHQSVQIVGDLKQPYHKDGILVTDPTRFFTTPDFVSVRRD